MAYRSRLKNRVINTLYKNTFLSIAAIGIVLAIVLFFGLQLLINISLLFGRVKSIGEVPRATEETLILTPMLDPLVEATNSARIKISGIGSQPGQTIEVFLNGEYKTNALVDNSSQFTVSALRLELGENRIKVKAKHDGKQSQFSDEVVVIYETTPPALEVQEPSDGQIVQKTPHVKIAGKTETDARVVINGFFPIVDGNGNFTYTLPLKEGENSIKIVATDTAGNQTTNEIKVTYEP